MRNKIRNILSLFFFSCCLLSSVWSQQDAQYSMYMFNGLALNPAYAGSREALSITLLGRMQWVGIQGAPKTATLGIHKNLGEKHGVGGIIISDNLGFKNQLGFYGNYAYRIPISTGYLALGLKGGLLNYSIRWTEADPDEYEPGVIPEANINLFLPTVGTGIYFSNDFFYAGISTPNFLRNKLTRADLPKSADVGRQVIHVFATAGAMIRINETFEIKPSFLLKYAENSPLSFDLNASLFIKQKVWVGLSYRTGDALLGMIEYDFKNGLRLGYAYDFTISELRRATSGSHELMIGFDIEKEKLKAITPRKF